MGKINAWEHSRYPIRKREDSATDAWSKMNTYSARERAVRERVQRGIKTQDDYRS